jgi:NAD(P)-dependent dehydrogenase (short-subunit alcohol dehydrogenase family)
VVEWTVQVLLGLPGETTVVGVAQPDVGGRDTVAEPLPPSGWGAGQSPADSRRTGRTTVTELKESLAGRLALVTGASSGLGRVTATALARAGADVALFARRERDLTDVAVEVDRLGRRAFPAPVDLADPDMTASAVDRVVAEAGRLDVLVNAAATDIPGPATALGVADWDLVLGVNLRAPFLLAKLAFPHMQRAGGGTIVNVSSVAGKRGWANASAYCASKFGLTGLTQALAAEGKPHGIRVCALYPGGMATHWGTFTPDDRARRGGEHPPATRALPPQHVADLIVWLACAPRELVLSEAIVTPLEETGWP